MDLSRPPVFKIAVTWSDAASGYTAVGGEKQQSLSSKRWYDEKSKIPNVIKIPVLGFQKCNLISIKIGSITTD